MEHDEISWIDIEISFGPWYRNDEEQSTEYYLCNMSYSDIDGLKGKRNEWNKKQLE